MGNFFENLQADKQKQLEANKEAKEAAEAKASEYAALSARVDRLERTIGSLENTISDMTTALQGITPQKIEQFQQAGVKVFDPMKATAAEINADIKAAGKEAAQQLRKASGKSWKESLLDYAMIALVFVVLDYAVFSFAVGGRLKEIENTTVYTQNRVNALHWNQTTGQFSQTYGPWDMKEFYEAWDNQDKFVREERKKQSQQQK